MPTPKVKALYLSFDIEEFDMPAEYGRPIAFDEQVAISTQGCHHILNLLQKHNLRATFFSTVMFAQHAPDVIARLRAGGHELASHGYYHSSFADEHLLQSREALEQLWGGDVRGFRMARMMPVSDQAIVEAGYSYNSSLNPVYLPGRYNNYFKPRTYFNTGPLLQIPASATPVVRVPLFWLSFHNFPAAVYRAMCAATMKSDGYLNIYFHPWEFTDLASQRFNFPRYVTNRTGPAMIQAFDNWLAWCTKQGYKAYTLQQFNDVTRVW